jgi:hypothetical protein
MTENQQLNNPSGPSTATIKRLFAESGNRCAFPKCTSPIVEGKTVVGKICHIRAREKGGPRFDANQTPAERHHYDNLILLCGRHHDVIDDDPDAYTVDHLQKMKSERMPNVGVLSEKQVEQGVRLLLDQSLSTTHQSGGITAHTVNIRFNGSTSLGPAEISKARTYRPTPNLVFTGADVAPVSGPGQTLWSRDMGRFEKQWVVEHGQIALLAKFTNEAQRASQNVGGLVRAQLIYRSQEGEFRRIGGCWLDAATDFIEFHVDETYELIIAVMLGGQVHTVEKRRVTVEFNMESIKTEAKPIPNLTEVTVVVRLTNADTGDFLLEHQFRFTTKPLKLVERS